jgi:uncharacterized protein YciI
VDFFIYSRDAADTAVLRDEHVEEHWAYMDGFAASIIARGPTLDADRETATGSLHVLGLPSVEEAHRFVALEPNNRAGIYAEHLIWRFENLLGRTMWESPGHGSDPRFLVIARYGERPPPADAVSANLIVYGALATLDGGEPAGAALALQAPDRDAVDALIRDELAAFSSVEIHDWELGGRR